VCHAGEPVLTCDFFLESGGETFVDFHHAAALAANEVMMVAIITFANQFKSCSAVAEVESFHHPHRFEHMHGPVNCGKITWVGQGRVDLPDGLRVWLGAKQVKDDLSWSGHAAVTFAQAGG
jgi:hypothetical protein